MADGELGLGKRQRVGQLVGLVRRLGVEQRTAVDDHVGVMLASGAAHRLQPDLGDLAGADPLLEVVYIIIGGCQHRVPLADLSTGGAEVVLPQGVLANPA